MSFWKSAAELALKAGSEISAANSRMNDFRAELSEKTDSELMRIVKSNRITSPMKSGAAIVELKNRGYSAEDIRIATS